MIFQIFFVALVIICLVYFLVISKTSAFQRLFVLFSFGLGILCILFPGSLNTIAQYVGIGRGADLILYITTLYLFCVSINFYLRFKRQEQQITLLVRNLALVTPKSPRARSEDSSG
ncbi:MAG: DUF2304 domain-containing protein [Myxococcota bacterium]|nr:DUF2304 domain-containing protein [Myxococcota bacterium]